MKLCVIVYRYDELFCVVNTQKVGEWARFATYIREQFHDDWTTFTFR